MFEKMVEAQNYADSIGCVCYLYTDGKIAASGSDLAQQYHDSGVSPVFIVKP